MHILFLVANYPNSTRPMAGAFYRQHAQALAKSHQVGVVAAIPLSWKDVIKSRRWWLLSERTINGVVEVVFSFPTFPLIWRLRDRLRALAIRRLVRGYVRQYGLPDILHIQNSSVGIGALETADYLRVPMVVVEHYRFFALGTLSRYQKKVTTAVFKQAASRFAVSSEFARELEREYGYPFHVQGNVVDTDFFQPAPKSPNRQSTRFLSVGALKPNKNHVSLVVAFAECFKGNLQYQLEIGGEGPERKNIELAIRENGVESQVELLGYLDRPSVLLALQGSDYFVLPSFSETFGVVLIEAMSCGLPVISVRSSGPESIVVDKRLGILCKPSVKSIGNALVTAVERNFDRSCIRSWTIDRYSASAFRSQMESHYVQLHRE